LDGSSRGTFVRWSPLLLSILLAAPMAVNAAAPAPVAADCGTAGSTAAIEGHRGFAFEGVVTSVEGRREPGEGWVDRITLDVSEMLLGSPMEAVAFDTGRGDCSWLQGDRYKAGDRLIVTATAPPIEGPVAYLPDALTWRYEWADRWSFHGLQEHVAATFPRAIRGADTRDEILALVAPDRLPYRVDDGAWAVTLARRGRDQALVDAVPWGEGFVALGGRTLNRHQGPRERTVPTVFLSPDGRRWEQAPDPFPEITEQRDSVKHLAAFRGRLYAFGIVENGLRVWSSDDGADWEAVDLGPATDPSSLSRRVVVGAAATADRLIVMTGPWSYAGESELTGWTTEDGTSWVRGIPRGVLGIVDGPVAGPDGFLLRQCSCSGREERWTLLASPNGMEWSAEAELPALSYGIAEDPDGRTLAATIESHEDGAMLGRLDASADGADWSPLVKAPGTDTFALGISTSGTRIVLLGNRYGRREAGSYTMASTDGGETWTYSTVPGSVRAECVRKAVIGASRTLLIGDCRGKLAWLSRS
jgi:hypothetical protein